jgi:hypothetical protein
MVKIPYCMWPHGASSSSLSPIFKNNICPRQKYFSNWGFERGSPYQSQLMHLLPIEIGTWLGKDSVKIYYFWALEKMAVHPTFPLRLCAYCVICTGIALSPLVWRGCHQTFPVLLGAYYIPWTMPTLFLVGVICLGPDFFGAFECILYMLGA